MKKRILTALLALFMVFALGTVSALAEGEDTGTTCNGEDCSHAAAIGTTHYNTLAGAIDAAEAATTDTVITLLNNVAETIDITKSNSGKIILDFGGKELEVGRINLKQGTLTVRNGTLTPADSVTQPLNIYGATDDKANSELNIESNLTIKNATYGICLFNDVSGTNGYGYGAVVNFNGKIISGVSGSNGIFVSGNLGNSEDSGSAISNAAHPNVININSGSEIKVTGDQGIAMNGQAIVNVKSGASITGREAIGVKRGVLNITGGTFVGNGTNATDPVSANNNGTEASGAAISVTSTYNKFGSLEVNISGGSFTSANSAAVYVGHSKSSSVTNAYVKGFDVNITDGTFKTESTNENATAVFVADKIESDNASYNDKVVTGGRFLKGTAADTSVKDYIPESVSMDIDTTTGEVIVDNAKTVATVDGVGYPSLQKAIDAAEEGDTIELTKDIPNASVATFTSNGQAVFTIKTDGITLDGNNHKITVTGNKADNVSTHVISINNAANVTVENLVLEGGKAATSGVHAYQSTNVEFNNITATNFVGAGSIVNGSTVTATNFNTSGNGWGGVNVDSKNYADTKFTLKSGTVQSVYTDSTSTTEPTDIVIDGGTVGSVGIVAAGNNSVVINDGYVEAVGVSVANPDITVNGGTFGESVDEYAASDLLYEVMVSGEYTYYKNASDAIAAAGSVGNVKYIGDKTSSYTSNVTFVYEKGVYTEITIEDGTTIRLPGGQYKGKTITGWTLGNVTYKDGDRYKVNGNATFYVVLKDGEFDITIDSKIEHGDISTNVNSADKGDTVYIYVDPDTGYVLDDIDVYYGLNYRYSVKVSYVRNNTYRFEMPNADVYITATFKANGMPFVDVHRTQWFYDSIYYVWSNDMMEGDSATTFNPDGTMTRAMFWAVLGRMDGQTITGTNWVEQARNWAMREGVSDGTNPNDYVTREQMVTMLWRYAGEKNGSANLNRYTDSGSVSGYAVEAMRWAIGNGVIQGVTSTTLAPKANATRAECATIFMRFDKM